MNIQYNKINIFFMVFSIFILVSAGKPLFAQSPNVIVILTDDLSVDAIETLLDNNLAPNIQQHLINEGIKFNKAYVTNPLCCPSRATLLTGMYSHNHGILSNLTPDPYKLGIAWPGWLPEGGNPGTNESTLPVWLQQAGYVTGFVGKYLNGYGKHAPSTVPDPKTYIPPGWDDWQGLIDPYTYKVFDYQLNDNGVVVEYGDTEAEYQTDVLSNRAKEFITEADLTGQPFFLLLSTLAPHIEVLDIFEILSSGDYREGFEGAIRPAPRHDYLIDGSLVNGEIPELPAKPSFNEPDMTDKPLCVEPPIEPGISFNTQPRCVGNRLLLREDTVNNQFQSMLASMVAVDDMVGELVQQLQSLQQLENTIVMFTSDNGWLYGEHRLLGKSLAYEESIHVPLYVRMPDMLWAGSEVDHVVLNNDLAPTIIDYAAATATHEIDGISMRPLLDSPLVALWHRNTFLVEHWFLPSLLKFEMATFTAIRRSASDFDFLYVSWRADQSDIQTVTHTEFYHHQHDPFQVNSIILNGDTDTLFNSFINSFRVCKGESCRLLEGI